MFIFGTFQSNFIPKQPQAAVFQKIVTLSIFNELKIVHSKCKRSSLRSQCWMRLFLRFSNTVYMIIFQGMGYGGELLDFAESTRPKSQVYVVSCRTDILPWYVWKERIHRNLTVLCWINHSSRNIDQRWTRNDQVTKTISWSGSYKISQFCYLRSHPYFHPFVFVFPWFRQKNLTWWNFAWYNNLEFSFIIFFLFCLIDTLLVLGLDLNNRYRGL